MGPIDNPIANQPHRPRTPLLIERALGQSLAGRTALLEILPLALEEMRRFPNPPRRTVGDGLAREPPGALRPGGDEILAVETKSGRTVADDAFAGLRPLVVFGGEGGQRRSAGRAVPWSEIDRERFWE